MILSYIDYKLNNHTVFERVSFKTPFHPSVTFDQQACFIYSISGNGMLYGGLEKDSVKNQESILMKCGSFLNHWNSSTETNEAAEVIIIRFTPEVIQALYENDLPSFLTSSQKPIGKVFQKIPEQTVINEYIRGLLFYFENPALMNEELIRLKLKELILLLYNLNYKNIRELLSTLFDPVELSFKSIVQSQLFEELNINEYAALTNTSLSTFKRKFKKVFGETPGKYIVDQRLQKAAKLLTSTNKRITEICFESGFSNLSTFSKSFSKKYACSPSEYRNNS